MNFARLLPVLAIFFSFSTLAQDKYILVGSGGGFSGASTVYKITDKGKVFKGTGIADIRFTECSKIKSKKAKALLLRSITQITAAGDFNHPGNMYYFISLTKDGSDTRRTWGSNDHPAPAELKQLYQDVIAEVGTLRYKPVK